MLGNYFRIAIRYLLKRKGYTFINIVGLALGIACCLLISLYIFNEVSYDSFFEKKDRLFRVMQTSVSPSKTEASATTPFKAGPSLESEYDRLIEASVRFFNMQEDMLTLDNEEADIAYRERNFYFADPSVFEVMELELIRGNPDEALEKPLSLVLTEDAARRYFGDADPLGRVLKFKGIRDLTVTGIMEALPRNSHMNIDILASFSSLRNIYRDQEYDRSWFWNPCWTYIVLREGVNKNDLTEQFPSFVDKYYKPQYPEGETVSLDLQPVTDIHLHSNLDQEMQANNSILYIYLFAGIGVFILVIACINFMNLATARAAERSREVGLRKTMGADRRQLFWQFMGESFLMSLLAVMLSVLLVQLILPVFNNFLNQQLTFNLIGNGVLLLGLAVIVIVVGLLSGLYPAFYLSSFQPVRVLKGEAAGNSRGVFRKSLVTFQFAFSIILIIGTVVIYLQLKHMQTTRLGFDKEQVVVMSIKQNRIAWYFENFKERMLSNPNVLNVSGANQILGSEEQAYYKYSPATEPEGGESSTLALYVTHDFIETYDIGLMAGRSFSKDFPSDPKQSVIINREMLKRLKVDTPEEAIGEVFYYYPPDAERESFKVIGVTDNFNYSSVKKEIKPLVIRLVEGEIPIVRNIHYASVRLAPGGIREGLNHLKEVWEEVNYIDPFDYTFHDQELNKVYASETVMSKVTGLFALICIVIACLGLFGLASYTSGLRTREIGIRKTLGASVSSIMALLSREYLQLVMIANVIAWPVIYYLVNSWLQNFPNRISMGWNIIVVFILSALASLLICLLTVSYQSVKAALADPVKSIRFD